MPCDCELDLVRRWVRSRAWGTVTFDEIDATRRKFSTDPNFSSDFSQIYDGREVTRLALTASEVATLAKGMLFDSRSRRAFVVPSAETYGKLRMYQTYKELNGTPEKIRLFRTIEEAEAWLIG